MRDVLLIVSIDTEEDNWNRGGQPVTLENIRELRRLAAFFDRLGVRPTYFTTYQVANERWAAQLVRDVCDGNGEIAAHLHPWNTPPQLEPLVPRNSMLNNLPVPLQLAKLQRLTATLEAAFDRRPHSFRAGRYGLGRDTVAALMLCGYRVDSSVTPFVSWEGVDDGPTFVGAPLGAYWLGPDRDVRRPATEGVLEIPLSCGFGRGPMGLWDPAGRFLDAAPLRPLRLAGQAALKRLFHRIALSPELASVDEMLALSRRLLERGVHHLQLSWHSPSLKPGLSPYAATAADVTRLYASVEAYLEGLSQLASVTMVTLSEAAGRLGSTSP